MNSISSTLAAILSGILLFLGFPPFELSFLPWVALALLFLAITERSPAYGFFLSLIFGIVFFVGIFNWILEVPGYTLIHHAILVLYLGSYFGVFGLAFSYIARRSSVTAALLAAPFLWVSLEYIRSNFFFLALPWGLLAHSQYQNLSLIQIAAITGAYGISFLIVTANSAIAAMVYSSLQRLKKDNRGFNETTSGYGTALMVFTAAVLITLAFLYGHLTISEPSLTGQKFGVALVQGNIEQEKKWDRSHAKFIMQAYAALTQKASKESPDLIVWPETATPRSINRDPALYGEVTGIARGSGTYLLLGSSHHRKFKGKNPQNVQYFNSAFLIQPEGKVKHQRYDKIRLFPFGEYLPLKNTIPWSAINVPDVTGTVPGKEFSIFSLPGLRFGVTICWENIFPDLVRQFVKRGAQVIVNITNEAWFGKTAAPYQFLSMNVFRAVEHRIYVVRCANTGVSCFIDPCGRVVDRVKDENGKDIFVRGVLTGSVIPLESRTFYTRYGDWLVWLSFSFSTVILVASLFRKKRDLSSMPLDKRQEG